MDSDRQLQTSAIARPVPPTTGSDGARIVKVLGGIVLVMFLLLSGGLLLMIEALSVSRPGHIEVDAQEMREAAKLVENRTLRLAELTEETTKLQTLIQQIRSGAARSEQPDSQSPEAAATSQPLQSISRSGELPSPDGVSRVYSALFATGSRSAGRSGLNQLSKLDDGQRRSLAQLVVHGLEVGHADPLIAMMAISSVGDDEAKAAVIRQVISDRSDVTDSSTQSEAGALMVSLCGSLPPQERADHLREVVARFSSINQSLGAIELATRDLPEDERAKLAVWIGHASENVRELAQRIVPEKSLWEAATKMLAGNDYNSFVYANRWLSKQNADNHHRQAVLDALGPVLLVRDGESMPSLDSFCKWADKSTADTIRQYLAMPIRNEQVINQLIDTALRLKIPLEAMIDQASDEPANQWFKRYIEGDDQVTRGMRQLLLNDPPLPSTLRWMDRISQHGQQQQIKDLQAAVDAIREKLPDSLLANRGDEYLRKMQHRLNE